MKLVRVDRLDVLALPPIDYVKSLWMVLTGILSEGQDLRSCSERVPIPREGVLIRLLFWTFDLVVVSPREGWRMQGANSRLQRLAPARRALKTINSKLWRGSSV